ncbi:MAG: hypothetical protein AAF215_05725 [Cyanobacteria bacterium P01_A01_bin.123]
MTLTSRSFYTASAFSLLAWLLLGLNTQGVAEPLPMEVSIITSEEEVAQSNSPDEEEEQPQRIGYFGLGGTLGLSDDGETKLGNGGFSIMSRIPLTEILSVHTASVVSSDGYSSFALTGSFPVGNQESAQMERPVIVPFAGVGIGVEFEDFDVDPMVTLGADIPITNTVTGTTRVNANFGEEGTDIGLVFGVGIRLFR